MHRAGWAGLLGVVCCGPAMGTGVPAAQSEGILFTVTNQTVHQIDRRMFGQFMERPSWGEIGVTFLESLLHAETQQPARTRTRKDMTPYE